MKVDSTRAFSQASQDKNLEAVGQLQKAPGFQLTTRPTERVVQREKKTPKECIEEAFGNYSEGSIDIPTLAQSILPYANTHGAVILIGFDSLNFFERDNLAYALADSADDNKLKTFDTNLLHRMVSELSGTFNTASWDLNYAMADRIKVALEGAAADKAAKEKQEKADRAKKAAEDAEFKALMDKSRLTTEEIAKVRVRIDAMAEGPEKIALYKALQEKVEYSNQRNVGTYAGEKAGGGSCNLTSLAMCMSYLGLSIPEKYKILDGFPTTNIVEQLEFIRRTEALGARTSSDGWGGVAEAVGAKKTFLVFDQVKKKAWWESEVRDAHLNKGHAVMCSIHGHITRIQGVNENGVVVDDPYGKSKLKAGTSRGWSGKNDSSREDLKSSNKGVGESMGEDHVWPWADVEIHNFHWIVAFEKAN